MVGHKSYCITGIIFSIAIFFSIFCKSSQAESVLPPPALNEYFEKASVLWDVPHSLLVAIANQESSMRPWCVNVAGRDYYPPGKYEAVNIANKALAAGKSFDVGLMQVNSYWLKKYSIPVEVAIEPHANIIFGAWILATELQKHGLNWKGVGSYHTPVRKNPARGLDYSGKILRRLKSVVAQKEALASTSANQKVE